MTPRILIAMPMREGFERTASIARAHVELANRYVPGCFTLPMVYAEDVVRARNRIAHIALETRPAITHVLWWDDDIFPDDYAIIERMLATKEHLIGAPYTRKTSPATWTHVLLDDRDPEDNVLEVRFVGMGFTLTSRRCLEYVSSESDRYADVTTSPGPWPEVADCFGHMFEHLPTGGRGKLSEDYSFCKRWRDLGGRVTIIGETSIAHVGTKAWSANDIHGVVHK